MFSPEYPFLKPVPQHISKCPLLQIMVRKNNMVPVAGSQGAEDRPCAQHTHHSSSSQERGKLAKKLLTYWLCEPLSLMPSRELQPSSLLQISFHILHLLSLEL